MPRVQGTDVLRTSLGSILSQAGPSVEEFPSAL